MDVFILRHGEAGQRLAMGDDERPLTVAGLEEVDAVAKGMKALKLDFDQIITSPIRRSRETAAVVAKSLGNGKMVETWSELKPEGSRIELYKKLSKLKQNHLVLLVGHEPYLSTMIGEIISGSSNCKVSLKKAGLAKIYIMTFTPKVSGELRWLLTPKQMKKIA